MDDLGVPPYNAFNHSTLGKTILSRTRFNGYASLGPSRTQTCNPTSSMIIFPTKINIHWGWYDIHHQKIHNMDMFMEDFYIFPLMFPIVSIIFRLVSMIFLTFSHPFWSPKSHRFCEVLPAATAASATPSATPSDKDGQLVVPIRNDLPGNTEASAR